MRNHHWAAGSATRTPIVITVKVLEKCLDRLAEIIDEAGDKGAVYLPIYERLETELEKLKAKDELMACIRARVKRQTAQKNAF